MSFTMQIYGQNKYRKRFILNFKNAQQLIACDILYLYCLSDTCFSCIGLTHLYTIAYHFACAQILVGWHLKEYRFQLRIVGLVFLVKHVFLDVSIEDGADVILEAVFF